LRLDTLKRQIVRVIEAIRIGEQVLMQLRPAIAHSRRLFRLCCDRFKRSDSLQQSEVSYRLYRLRANDSPTFFGYYDKTPFSPDNERILAMAMKCNRDWRRGAANFPLRLGYFELYEVMAGSPIFHQFGESSTWSWQQGSMLQWFPRKGGNLVIYNRLVDGQYGAVVQDIASKLIIKSYRMPIYTIDPAGENAVSLNFSRLERLRPGYGYCNLPDATVNDPCPAEEGIWHMDLETGNFELLISIKEVADLEKMPSMIGAVHYVNHLLFSPDGQRLAFLHLWLPNERNPQQRHNRLMLYDFDEGSLQTLDDKAIVSHFCWLSNNEILAFRYRRQSDSGYYIYTFDPNRGWLCVPLRSLEVSKDGHPSLSPNGEWLVIDTYPDELGYRHLYFHSLHKAKTLTVGKFFSPFRYRGFLRCDLHPRWDRIGKWVCIDSVHEGKRAIYVLDFGKIIDEEEIPL